VKAYFLTTRRLGFRRWTHDDLPLARELWCDAEVTALIGGPFSDTQVAARLVAEMETQTRYGIQYWPLFILDGDHFVGCAGLRPYPRDLSIVELGVHLLPRCWRQGYAEESCRAVIDYAFDRTGARAVFAGHHPDNHASERLLTKLGFTLTHREYYEPTGREHPSYLIANR
jgi:RimJ/RimL family protein N-acetyltransferase